MGKFIKHILKDDILNIFVRLIFFTLMNRRRKMNGRTCECAVLIIIISRLDFSMILRFTQRQMSIVTQQQLHVLSSCLS